MYCVSVRFVARRGVCSDDITLRRWPLQLGPIDVSYRVASAEHSRCCASRCCAWASYLRSLERVQRALLCSAIVDLLCHTCSASFAYSDKHDITTSAHVSDLAVALARLRTLGLEAARWTSLMLIHSRTLTGMEWFRKAATKSCRSRTWTEMPCRYP